MCGLGNGLVAQRAGCLEICQECFDVVRQLHVDVIMTSLWHMSSIFLKSVKNGVNKGIQGVERAIIDVREVRAAHLFGACV